jgi:hypothetical protein
MSLFETCRNRNCPLVALVHAADAPTGFQQDHLFNLILPVIPGRYPDAKKPLLNDGLLPKLAAIPGVLAALKKLEKSNTI